MDTLFEYGIQTEASDIRAHVSVVSRTVYVFPTRNGIEAIREHSPRLADATQPGVRGVTGRGWLVPIAHVRDLRAISFPTWPRWGEFHEPDLSTKAKGDLASQCVLDLMACGQFPFWVEAFEDDRREVQLAGTDITVFVRKRVQVKCDARAGATGNLFLQQAERNPLKYR